MGSIITDKIQKQGFELVLDQLGIIVLEELTNQKKLCNLDYDFEVYLERQEPTDKSEDVVISIGFDSANYSNKNQATTEGLTTYFIDIFTSGIESTNESGDDNSRIKSSRFLGMIRSILSSTKYKTLGFQYGLIGGTMVDSLQNQLRYGNGDGSFFKFARITFTVRIQENSEMWNGIELLGNDTDIKLSSTDKGLKLIFNT